MGDLADDPYSYSYRVYRFRYFCRPTLCQWILVCDDWIRQAETLGFRSCCCHQRLALLFELPGFLRVSQMLVVQGKSKVQFAAIPTRIERPFKEGDGLLGFPYFVETLSHSKDGPFVRLGIDLSLGIERGYF